MMIRALLTAVVSAAILLPAAAQAQDMDLRLIHFYESGYKATPKAQRRYISLLPKSSTRFVYWELVVRNNLYQVRDHSHTVVARWYRPNGSLLSTSRHTFRVRSIWSTAWYSAGKGYRTPGRWQLGKYRVDILVDGQLYARRHFLIYDDGTVDPDNPQFAFTGMRFFEGGYRPMPAAQRQYTTRFNRAATRYVYVEVAGRNLLYGQRDHYPLLEIRFFRQDGAYAGAIILNRAIVRSGWKTALLAAGWGARTPNNWAAGRYRAEVWLGNDQKAGEARIVVYSGAPPNHNNGREPEGTKPEDKPQTDRLPTQPPKANPPPKTPSKPKDIEELEKL
jgi:hypothetical protein